MASSERITVHNLSDLKNTSDDAIPNYLNSLKFTQSHVLTDVRLALGYTAFAVAAACFAWDYKLGWDQTKYYTAAAVVVYSLLNGALTLWIWLKEQGIVYEGTSPAGEKISIATSTKKNVPVYNLKITVTDKGGKQKSQDFAQSFTQWFDSQGTFVTLPFQEMLATSVPAIGRIDPKRVKSASSEYAPEVLDALLAASSTNTTGSASGAEAAAKKGGKRRKV